MAWCRLNVFLHGCGKLRMDAGNTTVLALATDMGKSGSVQRQRAVLNSHTGLLPVTCSGGIFPHRQCFTSVITRRA